MWRNTLFGFLAKLCYSFTISSSIFTPLNLLKNYYFIYWFYRTEASTFAGDDVFGSANKERTERSTEDTDCVGSQRSEASSPLISSSPGG